MRTETMMPAIRDKRGTQTRCGSCLPEPIPGARWELVLYLYCDESGKAPKSHYVSACGYLIDQKDIFDFSVAWNECLRLRDVPAIHMAKIFKPDESEDWGPVAAKWGSEWVPLRDEMLQELADL